MTALFFSAPTLPPFSRREIARYMKSGGVSDSLETLIDKGLSECAPHLDPRVVYAEFDIKKVQNSLDLGFAITESRDLGKLLFDKCDSIVLFAATLGIGIDRLLLKYGRTSPALALCIQAIGAERTEALCDAFSLEIKEKYAKIGCEITPRFSPGYGDLPLSLQKEIFAALSCEKHLGLTLNDSLIMSPTKSVTAIIGIKKHKENI